MAAGTRGGWGMWSRKPFFYVRKREASSGETSLSRQVHELDDDSPASSGMFNQIDLGETPVAFPMNKP